MGPCSISLSTKGHTPLKYSVNVIVIILIRKVNVNNRLYLQLMLNCRSRRNRLLIKSLMCNITSFSPFFVNRQS